MKSAKIFLKSDLPGNTNINIFFTEKSPLALLSKLGTQFFRQNKERQRWAQLKSQTAEADRTVNFNFEFFKHFQSFDFC